MASTLPIEASSSGALAMFGPGEYVPDSTEGIVDLNDLLRLLYCPTTPTMTTAPACDADIWLIATNSVNGPCTTWAI